MTDPYKVLGVSPNATDEQVKAAYRELARKYHPDNYQNNPLADLASEKMKEINEAYDEIQKMRKAGGNTGGRSYSGYAGGYGSYQGNSQFGDIRRLISSGRIVEAEELLNGVPQAQRDAEWYFLRGSVYYSKGWLDEAYQNFTTACRMNPANPEYRAALNQLNYQRSTGRAAYPGGGYAGGQPGGANCSCCDICATLYCLDCCCDCSRGC